MTGICQAKKFSRHLLELFLLLLLVTLMPTARVMAQTTGFTYQGALSDGGTMANGNYDLQFSLWDSVSGGNQIGSTQASNVVPVSNGIFSVTLDFGPGAFSGGSRFLEIGAKPSGAGSYTLLTPRQQLTSTPYAIRSLTSSAADGLSAGCSGCVTDANISGVAGSKINGAVPVASVPAGSTNYIQNATTQQATSNFNISGSGAADSFNAATQYNIGSARVFTTAGNQNVFAGVNAGAVNGGQGNSFFGSSAGSANTTGSNNSFFGGGAGKDTTAGGGNAFFGYFTGAHNTTGGLNAFFGISAGVVNSTGSSNSFFGATTGSANTKGNSNSFFGRNAGASNVDGNNNAYFGANAGKAGASVSNAAFFGANAGTANTASNNSFFGSSAGGANVTGTDNAFFGSSAGAANTASNNSFFGSLTGAANTTGISNSFFGAAAGTANSTGDGNSFFGTSSGLSNTTGGDNSFFGNKSGKANLSGYSNAFFGAAAGGSNISGYLNSFFGLEAGFYNTTGQENAFLGGTAGFNNTTGANNSFVGMAAGGANTTGSYNSFVGKSAGSFNLTGSNNTLVGSQTNLMAVDLTNATAIGSRAVVGQSNALVLGSINGVLSGEADTNVGIGTPTPAFRFTVKTATSNYGIVHTDGTIVLGSYVGGSANGGYLGTKSNHSLNFFVNDGAPSMSVDIGGVVHVNTLGSAGGTALCRNASNQISTCSSSLRYKTNIQAFRGGLGVINRLQPITFAWKADGVRDFGLGAEDVAKVEPLLTFQNDRGEIEGVKYSQLSVLLINAVKEQQEQIVRQQEQIRQQHHALSTQQQAIKSLQRLVYHNRPACRIGASCEPNTIQAPRIRRLGRVVYPRLRSKHSIAESQSRSKERG